MTKGMVHLMMAFGAMGSMMPDSLQRSHSGTEKKLTPEQLARIKRMKLQKDAERKKQQGLKEFEINGILVLALNEASAKKKVDKLSKNK